MNVLKFIAIILFVVLLVCAFKLNYTQRKLDLFKEAEQKALSENNSYAQTLFQLAIARYASDLKEGRKIIFSVQDSSVPFQSLSDGGFQIIFIPAKKEELSGFGLYATHYNEKVERSADILAMEGNFSQALIIYKLLEKYDRGSFLTNDISQRIKFLNQIQTSQDAENVKQLIQKNSFDTPHSIFEDLEK